MFKKRETLKTCWEKLDGWSEFYKHTNVLVVVIEEDERLVQGSDDPKEDLSAVGESGKV